MEIREGSEPPTRQSLCEWVDGGTGSRSISKGRKLLWATRDRNFWRVRITHVQKGRGTKSKRRRRRKKVNEGGREQERREAAAVGGERRSRRR